MFTLTLFSITRISEKVSCKFILLFNTAKHYKFHQFRCSYKNNIECEWTIKASPGNMITANVEMLDIDETDHCNGDYLEVRETSSTGKLVGVYCGRELPPTLAQANSYWLKFRSDNDGVGAGFLLEYNYGNLT